MEVLCLFVEVLSVFVQVLCLFVEILSIYRSSGFICGGFECICKKVLTCIYTESHNIRTNDRGNK